MMNDELFLTEGHRLRTQKTQNSVHVCVNDLCFSVRNPPCNICAKQPF